MAWHGNSSGIPEILELVLGHSARCGTHVLAAGNCFQIVPKGVSVPIGYFRQARVKNVWAEKAAKLVTYKGENPPSW
jgi:hypothetical protein